MVKFYNSKICFIILQDLIYKISSVNFIQVIASTPRPFASMVSMTASKTSKSDLLKTKLNRTPDQNIISGSLAGQFLIATPVLQDERFHETVIYMCVHDEEQAMGIVINKPRSDLNITTMLSQAGILSTDDDQDGQASTPPYQNIPVLDGGPLEGERGFVLHSRDFFDKDISLPLSPTLALSTNKTVLEALVCDNAPKKIALALGYAGWDAGQLEFEIKNNSWITAPAVEDMIFDHQSDRIWHRALGSIGIDPQFLSPDSGTA